MAGRGGIRAIVALVCERLTDEELADLNNAAQVDWDPRKLSGYGEVKNLFEEGDGTWMADDMKEALASVVLERLG